MTGMKLKKGFDFGTGLVSQSAKETKKFGEKFAAGLTGGEVLALVGNLGSGKTTFVQGLAKGIGIKQGIISPTFILLRKYDIRNGDKKPKSLYHIDLYRLESNVHRQLIDLGFDEIVKDENGVIVIEWADKAADAYPKYTKWVRFTDLGSDERKIEVI